MTGSSIRKFIMKHRPTHEDGGRESTKVGGAKYQHCMHAIFKLQPISCDLLDFISITGKTNISSRINYFSKINLTKGYNVFR